MMADKTEVLESTVRKIGRDVLHTTALIGGGIPNGADFNEYFEMGNYNINSHANASNNLNMPAKVAGMLEIIVSNYFIKQVYTTHIGDRAWIRMYYPYNNSWGVWKQVY